MSAEQGRTACAQMLLSGTASGVIGASHVAELAGFPNAISFDVGGTSADVAFIQNARPQYGIGEMVGGLPDLHSECLGDFDRRRRRLDCVA